MKKKAISLLIGVVYIRMRIRTHYNDAHEHFPAITYAASYGEVILLNLS